MLEREGETGGQRGRERGRESEEGGGHCVKSGEVGGKDEGLWGLKAEIEGAASGESVNV